MRILRNILFLSFSIIMLSSCNPIGEKLAEISLEGDGIATVDNINLKKGDVITIWTKVIEKDDSYTSKSGIRYNIECNGKSILFDSLNVNITEHVINSKKLDDSYIQSSSEKDSTVYYTMHQYETESKKFTAPIDGKYSFDFKPKRNQGSSFQDTKLAVILRKP